MVENCDVSDSLIEFEDVLSDFFNVRQTWPQNSDSSRQYMSFRNREPFTDVKLNS